MIIPACGTLTLLLLLFVVLCSPSASNIALPDSYPEARFATHQGLPLNRSFVAVCGENLHSFTALTSVWNHHEICSKWDDFHDIGTFEESDFIISPPRHLVQLDGRWVEEQRNDAIIIPKQFCVFEAMGWFAENGLLFDCHHQYPLIVKKREDFRRKMILWDWKQLQHGVVYNITAPLYSVVIPFNGAFSHTFSTGVSMLVYILYFMARETESRILIPAQGPFQRLLEAVGMPKHRVVVAAGKMEFFYSHHARLIFRQPPFNIICAHWPSRAVVNLREKVINWLVSTGYVNLTEPQNLIIYLWRPGVRSVVNQQQLVDSIRTAIEPNGYQLVVEGKSEQIHYDNPSAAENWIKTAQRFVRAAAVIRPHGGAFGNIFLCRANTTVIEFNIPWTSQTADGDTDGRVNVVRDLLYSLARGINITSFWNVWPHLHHPYIIGSNNSRNHIDRAFYMKKRMYIIHEEVVAILRQVGIAG